MMPAPVRRLERRGSGRRRRCCVRLIKIGSRHSRVKAGVFVGHRHRQRDRDFRLDETKFEGGDGNAGLTAGIDAIKARRLGGRTVRYPQVDVAKIALRPLELENLAIGAECRVASVNSAQVAKPHAPQS